MTDQTNPAQPQIEEAEILPPKPEAGPDPVPETTPEPKAAPVTAQAPAPARRGGFAGMLLGGVLAAGAGFGLATWGVQAGWPFLQPKPAVQPADLQALAARIDALQAAQIDPARLAALESGLAAIALPDVSALETRLAALESRPAGEGGGDPAALAELREQIGTLATRLAEQQTQTTQISAEIERQVAGRLAAAETESSRLKAEAEAQQQAAERRAALLSLQGVIESGLPAADAIARAEAAGLVLPDAVKALASAPATLADLQAQFAADALPALNASLQATMGDGWQDRLTTFLRTQTGARSLTPKEGSDPDAVLSRAEAALKAGDVRGALARIAELPPEGQALLAPWAEAAGRHAAGHAALAQLLSE